METKLSRPARRFPVWKSLIAIVVLFGAIAVLQIRIDLESRSEARQEQELLVTSGPVLKKLSLGYAPLLADIYWTRAVQYYGSHLTNPDLDVLAPLLNIAVTLDPHLIVAYRFGAVFLSAWKSGTDLAINLVKRGIAANPNEWRLDQDLGFLYYWRVKDYKSAAQAYMAGANMPGAPSLLLRLYAAGMAKKGGSLEMSEMIFAGLYRSTQDKHIKQFALEQLQSLKAQDDEIHLDELIQRYRNLYGRNPGSISDLVAAKMIRGVPLDPEGYPYVLGPDGKSRLDPRSPIQSSKP
ncbi:MAG TPA: hypothetical protein VMF66_09170 [Candidatus Acidoferrum sp.]|nr:hypothetical protein [Candidatus Acidoferrum sp.]